MVHDILILAGVVVLLAITCALAIVPAEILHRRQKRKGEEFMAWLEKSQKEYEEPSLTDPNDIQDEKRG